MLGRRLEWPSLSYRSRFSCELPHCDANDSVGARVDKTNGAVIVVLADARKSFG